MQQVERVEEQPMRFVVNRRSQRTEIGDAALVLDDHLAVDDGRSARQPPGGSNDRAVPVGPIGPPAGERSGGAAIDDEQGAVPVVLDLVEPAVAGGSSTRVGSSGGTKPRGAGVAMSGRIQDTGQGFARLTD